MRDESDVSYHEVIGRNVGEFIILVLRNFVAWAVGFARPHTPSISWTNANQATYNIALSGAPPTKPTAYQLEKLEERVVASMKFYGWGPDDVEQCITDHAAVAVFGPQHKRAGQRGRKPDVSTGGWLSLTELRESVSKKLR
jgi:hypothetical protein